MVHIVSLILSRSMRRLMELRLLESTLCRKITSVIRFGTQHLTRSFRKFAWHRIMMARFNGRLVSLGLSKIRKLLSKPPLTEVFVVSLVLNSHFQT